MALDLGKIKKRQKETEAKSRGGFWKPEEGKNTIRVFPFTHKVTKEDVKAGLFDKDKVGKTVTELDRPVVRFFPGGGAPVHASDADVAAWRKKMDKASKSEQAKLRKEGPQQHWMLNIVDTGSDEQKVVEYAANKTVYNAVLAVVLDEEDGGEDVLGPKGRDFIITYDPNKEGAAKYSVSLRDEKKSEKLPETLEEQVKDFYDSSIFEALGSGEAAEEEEEDEEDEDESEEEESEDVEDAEDDEEEDDDSDEDEDDEDDLDDEEDEDEEEDDEDEEEEEAPKSSKKGKATPKKKGKK